MRIQKILTTTLIALGLLTLGHVTGRSQSSTSSVIEVEKMPLLWKDERVIASKIPGVLDRVYVEEGEIVEPDQVLAHLDDRQARAEWEIQELLGKSDLGVQIAQKKVNEYNVRKEISAKLAKGGAVSEEEDRLARVNAEVNLLMHKQEIEKQQIEKLKAQRTTVTLEDHDIISPIRAIVQKRYKREKESLSPNEGLQMFRLVAIDKLWAQGLVKEQYIYRVRKGQRVQVQLVFQDDEDVPQSSEVFEGRIVFVDPEVEAASHTFLVRAEVDNRDDILHAGLWARMRIFADPPGRPAKVTRSE